MLWAKSARIGRYLRSIPMGAVVVEDEAVAVVAAVALDVVADAKDVVATTEDGDRQSPLMVSMSVAHPTILMTRTLIKWDVRVETMSLTNVSATERDATGAAVAVAADMVDEGATMMEGTVVVTTMIVMFSRPTPSGETARATTTRIAAH